jgi:hypothetical protein
MDYIATKNNCLAALNMTPALDGLSVRHSCLFSLANQSIMSGCDTLGVQDSAHTGRPSPPPTGGARHSRKKKKFNPSQNTIIWLQMP